ncbi:MAG TPA: hypothetical protein VMH30_01590, partial [Verrucomicrobiae bacterium]|nr:hypothetical protein [Verrucomicrobiae bacterium]
NRWINFMAAGGAFRRKETKRAYAKHYGSEKLQFYKNKRHFKFLIRRAMNRAMAVNLGRMEFEEFFEQFHHDITELIKMLKSLGEWRDPEAKREIIEATRKRLEELKNAINEWLNSN